MGIEVGGMQKVRKLGILGAGLSAKKS